MSLQPSSLVSTVPTQKDSYFINKPRPANRACWGSELHSLVSMSRYFYSLWGRGNQRFMGMLRLQMSVPSHNCSFCVFTRNRVVSGHLGKWHIVCQTSLYWICLRDKCTNVDVFYLLRCNRIIGTVESECVFDTLNSDGTTGMTADIDSTWHILTQKIFPPAARHGWWPVSVIWLFQNKYKKSQSSELKWCGCLTDRQSKKRRTRWLQPPVEFCGCRASFSPKSPKSFLHWHWWDRSGVFLSFSSFSSFFSLKEIQILMGVTFLSPCTRFNSPTPKWVQRSLSCLPWQGSEAMPWHTL